MREDRGVQYNTMVDIMGIKNLAIGLGNEVVGLETCMARTEKVLLKEARRSSWSRIKAGP